MARPQASPALALLVSISARAVCAIFLPAALGTRGAGRVVRLVAHRNLLGTRHEACDNPTSLSQPFAPSEVWDSMRRSFFAAALLLSAYAGLTLALTRDREAAPKREIGHARLPRLLPGVQPTGEVQLPN